MKTRAAVLTGPGREWEVQEFDLDPPRAGEVLVRVMVGGLCHSDKHQQHSAGRYPLIGGHEGAGIVEAIGEGVTGLAAGDHVACSWIPSCGVCRFCVRGQSNLCDLGAKIPTGELASGGFRFHRNGEDAGGFAALGTFSQWAVVDQRSAVKVDKDIPLEWASLVTCAVATGWGSVVNSGNVRAGDAVAIYGSGGIGVNAVSAAVSANAGLVAVIDPVAAKRDFALKLGADHVYATAEEAHADVWERTHGVGVDVSIVTTGVVTADVVREAYHLTRKGGSVVLTAIADDNTEETLALSSSHVTSFNKRIIGSLYGECNPRVDIPRLLQMAQRGKLDLDSLVTRKYALDDINQGFADMLAGENIRGIIVHEH